MLCEKAIVCAARSHVHVQYMSRKSIRQHHESVPQSVKMETVSLNQAVQLEYVLDLCEPPARHVSSEI
jgi:hypothetical protein